MWARDRGRRPSSKDALEKPKWNSSTRPAASSRGPGSKDGIVLDPPRSRNSGGGSKHEEDPDTRKLVIDLINGERQRRSSLKQCQLEEEEEEDSGGAPRGSSLRGSKISSSSSSAAAGGGDLSQGRILNDGSRTVTRVTTTSPHDDLRRMERHLYGSHKTAVSSCRGDIPRMGSVRNSTSSKENFSALLDRYSKGSSTVIVGGGIHAEEERRMEGKHILTEQKNSKFSKKYLTNIFQSPLY